jgi:GNAT superfamily N-acetyltransferase
MRDEEQREPQLADFSIRTVAVADAPSIVSLGRAIDRDQLATEASFRSLLERESEPTTERLVAEAGGRIVAWAPSGVYASRHGWFWIGVDRPQRRRGLGGRLLQRIEARLRGCGATHIDTTPNDEDGRRFVLARGFEVANVVRNFELDPRTVALPAQAPDGVRVASLRDALDRAEALFRLYAEGRADIPSETERPPWTFDEWRAETIDSPLIDYDASVVVFEGDEPVALAWLYADRTGRRAEALMSATRRDRRGRGLATLAKVESSRRAARLGITRIRTSNDLDNAPMIAVNRKLGFTETAVVESFVKQL